MIWQADMTNEILTSPAFSEQQRCARFGFQDIAVHLDGSPEDDIRLAHAEFLAKRFDSHLTGLFTNLLPDPALYASI